PSRSSTPWLVPQPRSMTNRAWLEMPAAGPFTRIRESPACAFIRPKCETVFGPRVNPGEPRRATAKARIERKALWRRPSRNPEEPLPAQREDTTGGLMRPEFLAHKKLRG